jgi:hypothetical protein
MTGVVTKKDFFLVLRSFGLKKALKLFFSRERVALVTLMS